ncbi:MAG: DUF1467 family protein [Hyphomonadaceae bacterium]|nr:DUF1467 family protein [Hyphomonadaceae bacterium]
MSLTGAIVFFVILWWLCFFTVLPIGVRGQFEDGSTVDGTEEAAPVDPMIGKKALWATYGAVALTALLLVITHIIDFQALMTGG